MTPKQPTEQHMEALGIANEIRIEKARIKRSLGKGEVTLEEVLRNRGASGASSAKVEEILRAIHRVGRKKAEKICRYLHISPTKRLGDLSDRQVDALLSHMRRRCSGLVF